MITPTRPWSHLPLDILQNAACARRTVELDYGHTQRRNGLPHVRGDEPSICHRTVTNRAQVLNLS